jgi:hydroxymethylpyrimidine pyrophosphatase-like HAD family hydrolase
MIVVSDLDGTLLDSSARLSPRNRSTLQSLGDQGVVRVVATGRSLHSARLVLDDGFPIDYLVFSSGAGVVEWRSQRLMLARDMAFEEAWEIAGLLRDRRLDFMLHHGVPDNHHFFYYHTGAPNPDFDARCARYEAYAKPWPDAPPSLDRASQLLAIEPRAAPSQFDDLDAALPAHNVILTTSPLDHASRWIEIFPRTVSKAMASAWLCGELGVDAGRALAVGNDYNDIELLEWAPDRRVVANAPPLLRNRYETVVSNDADGFSEAVDGWLRG